MQYSCKFNSYKIHGLLKKSFRGILGAFIHMLERPHDKTNKMSVRPAKTQISLGIQSDQSHRCALIG